MKISKPEKDTIILFVLLVLLSFVIAIQQTYHIGWFA